PTPAAGRREAVIGRAPGRRPGGRGFDSRPAEKSAGSSVTKRRLASHDRSLLHHPNEPRREVSDVVPEAIPQGPCPAVAAAAAPSRELQRRLLVAGRRVDAAAPLPNPRLRGRLVLRLGVGPGP